jgi:hypothetical protein
VYEIEDGMFDGAGYSENETSLSSGSSPESRRSFLGALLSVGERVDAFRKHIYFDL